MDILRDLAATPIQLEDQGSAKLHSKSPLARYVDDRSPSKPPWGEEFCRNLDSSNDLQREQPSRFCYHFNSLEKEECERHFISKDGGMLYRCISWAPEPKCMADTVGVMCASPQLSVSPPPPLILDGNAAAADVHSQSDAGPITHADPISHAEEFWKAATGVSGAGTWLENHRLASLGAGLASSVVLVFAVLGVMGTLGLSPSPRHTRVSTLDDESDDDECSAVSSDANGGGYCSTLSCAGKAPSSIGAAPSEWAPAAQDEASELTDIVEHGRAEARKLRADELAAIGGVVGAPQTARPGEYVERQDGRGRPCARSSGLWKGGCNAELDSIARN
eukprot:4927393-Prymnesium_polylepis.1